MAKKNQVPASINLLKLLAIYPLTLAIALPFSLFQEQAKLAWIESAQAGGDSSDDSKGLDALQKQVQADDQAAEKTRDAEFQQTVDSLNQTIQKQAHRHPLDQWRLLDQSSFAIHHPERLMDQGALQFFLVSSDGSVQSDLGNDRSAMAASVADLSASHPDAYLEIRHRGVPVFRFDAPVQSVAWVGGRYLVFTEPGTLDQSSPQPVQEVSFMDLGGFRKVLGTGNDRVIPVYKFFRKIETQPRSYELMDAASVRLDPQNPEQFFVGGSRVTLEVLNIYEQAENVALNQSVALASPQFYERAAESLGDLPLYFERMTEIAARTADEGVVAADGMRALFEERFAQLKTQRSALNPKAVSGDAAALPQEAALLASMQRLTEQERATRQLVNRAKLVLSKATLFDEPQGPEHLRNALLEISTSFKQSTGYKKAARALMTRDGMIDFLRSPVGRLGSAAAAVFLVGAITPDDVRAQFLYQSLEIARYLGEGMMSRVGLLGELARDATDGTFGWMKDFGVLRDAYMTGERPLHLAIGLAAINATVFLALGIPHVTVNAYRLAKDFREDGTWAQLGQLLRRFKVGEAFKGLVPAFIQRQERAQTEYLKTLADAEAESQGRKSETAIEFTPEQEKQVEALLAQAVEPKVGLWSRAVNKIKQSRFFQKFSQKKPAQAMGLGAAIRHFFFSSASFTNAVYAYTHIWQNWFRFRTLPWHPTQMVAEFLYPQYRKVISMSLPKGEVQAPTVFNGGLRNRFDRIVTFFNEDRQTLDTIEEWESAVLPVEARFRKAALQVSFRALVEKYGSRPDVLQKLFSKPGLAGMGDQLIPKLAAEARLYLQSLNDLIFENAMQEYVRGLESGARNPGDPANLSLNEIKVRSLETLKKSPWLEASNEEVLRHLTAISNRPGIKEAATHAAQHRFTSLSAIATRYKHGLWRSYQESPQLERMQSVDRQLKNPRAVARAARSLIASTVIDKPMELAFAFLFLAGMTDPLLKPLHDEMFSENSTFFLSKYEFWNGFVSSMITGMIGDPWVKLQQDEQHEGSFDQVPEGDDAKLSYLKWFWKKFMDPSNTLWKNQRHYIKLIVPNIRPALTTYLTINLLTLGRFDLDMWFMGYFMAFVLPIGGFAYKLEQAFELSTGWLARNIPKELRTHPKIQERLNRETSVLRIRFNFFYKIYENIEGYWLSSLGAMKTVGAGTRALTRIVSPYGFTPTEWMTYAAQLLRGKSWAPAPLVAAADYCVHLLTNNYAGLKSPGTGTEFQASELPARNNAISPQGVKTGTKD